MDWLAPTFLTAVLTVGIPIAWQAISERHRRPLVQVHYWWVHVLDGSNLWRTPRVMVTVEGEPIDSATRQHVWALRVRVKNTSRKWVVTPEQFGEARLTVGVASSEAHGWRGHVFPRWSRPTGMSRWSYTPTVLKLSLPNGLAPRRGCHDDFTVTSDYWMRLPDDVPNIVLERTASELRMRAKPWEPATSRPVWAIPARIIRWRRNSYRPEIYVQK